MAFAQGSRSRLSYVTEVTYGTTPATTFQQIPYTTHSLDLAKEQVVGTDIQSDRMPRHNRHGNKSSSGDIVFDLRKDNYDDFLESLMFSTWDASPSAAPDELKVGTTLKSFSIEDYAANIDQARLFTGMAVSQASFSIAPNQMVTSTMSFVGSDMSISATEETSPTAAALNSPFDPYSGAVQIADNGGSLGSLATITSLDFTINNSLAPTFVVGSDANQQLEYGRCEVEGTISAYFEDATLINRFLNETETAFKVAVQDDSSNEYSFFFPRVKFNGASVPVANPQSRIISIPFVALYDTTEESNVVIYRPDST